MLIVLTLCKMHPCLSPYFTLQLGLYKYKLSRTLQCIIMSPSCGVSIALVSGVERKLLGTAVCRYPPGVMYGDRNHRAIVKPI